MDEIEQLRREVEDLKQLFLNHTHNGIDSPRIDPKDLKGFPILTAAPTDTAEEGTIRLANESGTEKLYARINKAWVSEELT